MKVQHLIVMLVLNVCWAATMSANKALGQHLDPGGITTLRFGLAAVGLTALWPWLPGKAPRGRDLLMSLLIGLLVFVLGQRLQVLGNELGKASDSAVLMALEPLMTTVAAALFLREHVGPRRVLGFGVGMVGVLLLNRVWRPEFHWTGLGPSLIFVSSFLCETAYSILGKPVIERAGLMKVLALALLGATVANLLIDGPKTLAAARTLPLSGWLLLAYLAAVCTAVGYGLWYVVIKEAEVNVVAMTIFVQPVAGVAMAAAWLGEPLHWGQLWGSLTIAAGLVFGLSRQIKREPK
jgi:O-acetylserine/cysteine efflux transporter